MPQNAASLKVNALSCRGCVHRPTAGTSHAAASQPKQPESLLYFRSATKET